MKFHTAIAGLTTLLTLTACSGGDNTNVQTGGNNSSKPFYSSYSTSEFSIDVPEEWELINDFNGKYPEEIQIAFRSNMQEPDYSTNVAVFREDNPEKLTNMDYSQLKLKEHKKSLINYSLLGQEEVTLQVSGGESKSFINTIEGQNSFSGPTLTFQQTYLTRGGDAWTVTASYSNDVDAYDIELIDHMLKSFTLK